MAVSVEARIAEALLARAAELAEALALPIELPNGPNVPGPGFRPPVDGKYLRASLHRVPGGWRLIGSDEPTRFAGIVQMSVFWPLNRGEVEPLETAAAVAAHFPTDLLIMAGDVSARILRRPDIGPMLIEPAGVHIPVSIHFEAYA